MELRHIRYFVRAADYLHFTRAAESLYISQPTLSTHIHQLEEELGLPLFNRVGRQVRLTEAGEVLLEHSLKALRDLDLALEQIWDMKGMMSGKLRIGHVLLFGHELMPAWLEKFHDLYPQIQMDVKTGTSRAIEGELKAGSIELGLSVMPWLLEGVASEWLLSQQLALVVSQVHPLAGLATITLEQLSTVPLASLSRQASSRVLLDSELAKKNLSLNIVVEIDDLQALLKIAAVGTIGTILVDLAVADYPDLRLIPIEGIPPVTFGIIWNLNSYLSPPAKAFVDFVRQECSLRFR